VSFFPLSFLGGGCNLQHPSSCKRVLYAMQKYFSTFKEIYPWRNVICFVVIRSTELGGFRSCSCGVLESSGWGGHGLGPMTFGLVMQKFLNIEFFSLKIKLNCSWNFRRNWNMPLVFLERSWWAGFDRIYLIRFGFRIWEILIFKWFLPLKVQINFKKSDFERKNQLRRSSHLGQQHSPH
jgi:hypothetical protein